MLLSNEISKRIVKESYRIGEIVRQMEDDVANCKEIWLTSTDNGCYGLDLKTDSVELLEKCSNIEGE